MERFKTREAKIWAGAIVSLLSAVLWEYPQWFASVQELSKQPETPPYIKSLYAASVWVNRWVSLVTPDLIAPYAPLIVSLISGAFVLALIVQAYNERQLPGQKPEPPKSGRTSLNTPNDTGETDRKVRVIASDDDLVKTVDGPVDVAWAHNNCAGIKVYNGTEDYMNDVQLEISSLDRQLVSGKWFEANVVGQQLPAQLDHLGISIRPEKSHTFSFIKTSTASRISGTFAGPRNGMVSFDLREKGRYRVRVTVSWVGGRPKRCESSFTWSESTVLPDGPFVDVPTL